MYPNRNPQYAYYAQPAYAGARQAQEGRPDVLRIALFVFVIVSISAVQAYFAPLRLLRVGLLSWAVSLGCVLFMPSGVRWSNVSTAGPAKGVIALVVLCCLSIPFGLSIGQSGSYFLNVYSRIVLLFFMLVVAIRSVSDLRFLMWGFAIAGGILGVLSITVMNFADTGAGARLAGSHMYDANDLGLVFLIATPIALLLFDTSKRMGKALALACLGAMGMGIAMTGSRGAFVGMMVVLPALFVGATHISIVKRFSMLGVLVAGLVFAAPDGYWERIATVFNPSEDYNMTSETGRMAIAKRGLGYMARYPMTGVGIANFPRAEGTISEAAQNHYMGEALPMLAPHNTYVQVGAEMGIPALLLWVSLLGIGTIGLRSVQKRWTRAGLGGPPGSDLAFLGTALKYLPISFLAFASTSFFVSHAYTPIFYILTAYLCGLLIFVQPLLAQRAATGPGRYAASYGPTGAPPVAGPVSGRGVPFAHARSWGNGASGPSNNH